MNTFEKMPDQILGFLAIMQDGCERGLFEVLPEHLGLVKATITFVENHRSPQPLICRVCDSPMFGLVGDHCDICSDCEELRNAKI